MREIRRIIFHHSASPVSTTLEKIREWHVGRGWSDIGYHFVIERHGLIRHGRSVEKVGAHAEGANEDSIGVCITGDNTSDTQGWHMDQIDAAQRLVDAILLLWPEAEILGHRDIKATECPGLEIREVIQRRMPRRA